MHVMRVFFNVIECSVAFCHDYQEVCIDRSRSHSSVSELTACVRGDGYGMQMFSLGHKMCRVLHNE